MPNKIVYSVDARKTNDTINDYSDDDHCLPGFQIFYDNDYADRYLHHTLLKSV